MVFFSTHILSEAEATCDRIAIIHNGKMVADDTTANLKQGAQENSKIRLSLKGALKDDATSLLKSIHSCLDVKNIDPVEKDLVSFEIDISDDESKDHDFRSDIYLKIKETDWIIVQLIKESQTLEKIFRELTREEA